MKYKKAQWQGPIIKAVLAIVIILTIIWILPAQIKEPVKRLFGLTEKIIPESELAVTEAEFKINDLKTLSNSVDALMCAINSISSGKYPHSSCNEPYDIYKASLTEVKVDQTNYAQKIGDSLLECFKNYDPEAFEVLPCYMVNPPGDELEIDINKIQLYLEKLEDKDEDADDLAGNCVCPFDRCVCVNEEYSIKLSQNKIRKGAIMCGYNNKIVFTNDKSDCGLVEEEKCDGENERKYGYTCLNCEYKDETCCEYCVNSMCDETINIWTMDKEQCRLKYLGGKVVGDDKCLYLPTELDPDRVAKGSALQHVECTIRNFVLPKEVEVKLNKIGNNLVLIKPKELKKEIEAVEFRIFSSEYTNLILMDSLTYYGKKLSRFEFINPCKADLNIKKYYCEDNLLTDDLKGLCIIIDLTLRGDPLETNYCYQYMKELEKQSEMVVAG